MKKHLSIIVISLVLLLLPAAVASAATSIAKGYVSKDDGVKTGMAVSLSDTDQSVERASLSNKAKYLGIATKIDDTVITIQNKTANVYVSNSGQYKVYVSDVNGDIKNGDTLVLSPLKGVLMKRSDSQVSDTAVAIALEDFNTDAISSQEVTTTDGKTKTVKVGLAEAEINTSTTISQEEPKKFLSVFGESLTGKPVSELRVLVACVILLMVLIVEGSILYGAVSSSITAVGRNPLSKDAVYKQLIHTSLLAGGVLIFGVVGVYVVIWT